MIKRYWPAALALLLLFAVHLHPAYALRVEGERLDGLYSGAQIRQAREAALEAAEEILDGKAALPALRTSFRLRIRRPDGETAALTDALLRATDAVSSADAVWINGSALGCVEDGKSLLALLRQTIRGDMPAEAAVGKLGGKLQIHGVYTHAGAERGEAEMLTEILAAAPVF